MMKSAEKYTQLSLAEAVRIRSRYKGQRQDYKFKMFLLEIIHRMDKKDKLKCL